MTPIDHASAWEAMSDTEKVEWLATRVMGWRRTSDSLCPEDECVSWSNIYAESLCGQCNDFKERTGKGPKVWNPLTDWNHWRSVEMKVMEDEGLWNEYYMALTRILLKENPKFRFSHLLIQKPDLPTRARALYIAFHSLPH